MKLLSTICIVILLASCNTKTKSSHGDTELIDSLSLPTDSLAFYFPSNSFSDKPDVDTKWCKYVGLNNSKSGARMRRGKVRWLLVPEQRSAYI